MCIRDRDQCEVEGDFYLKCNLVFDLVFNSWSQFLHETFLLYRKLFLYASVDTVLENGVGVLSGAFIQLVVDYAI